MTKVHLSLIAVALLVGCAVPSFAGWTAYQDAYYGAGDTFVATNWGISPAVYLTFGKWDTTASPYTLIAMEWTFEGAVQGDVKIENTSGSSPNSITYYLQAKEKLMLPDLTTLSEIIPLATGTTNFPVYDGTTDYGGTSGATYTNLTGTAGPNSGTVGPGPNLDLFKSVGPGNILLPASAQGQSYSLDTAGDQASSFKTDAKVHGRIRYQYDDSSIPEPGTASLMLAGLAAVGLLRRRRSA